MKPWLAAILLSWSLSACLSPNANFQPWGPESPSCNFINYNDSGSEPYAICNYQQLQSLAENPSGWGYSYVVTAPISFPTDFVLAQPIGNSTTQFTGVFNGNGYTISNAIVNCDSSYYSGAISDNGSDAGCSDQIGFFGKVSGVVEDLVFDQLSIYVQSSGNSVGAIGENTGSIQNVQILNSQITGYGTLGALVGLNYGTVEKSAADSSYVSGTSSNVGGLVGMNSAGAVIEYSYSGSEMHVYSSGGDDVGGLVGTSSGTIEHSYSSGNVTGANYVGGLIGNADGGTITDCFSGANVTSSEATFDEGGSGGNTLGYAADVLVGETFGTPSITNLEYVATSGSAPQGECIYASDEDPQYECDTTGSEISSQHCSLSDGSCLSLLN